MYCRNCGSQASTNNECGVCKNAHPTKSNQLLDLFEIIKKSKSIQILGLALLFSLCVLAVSIIIFIQKPSYSIKTIAGNLEVLNEESSIIFFLDRKEVSSLKTEPNSRVEFHSKINMGNEQLITLWRTNAPDTELPPYHLLVTRIDASGNFQGIRYLGAKQKVAHIDRQDGSVNIRVPVVDDDKVGFNLHEYSGGEIKTYRDWQWKREEDRLAEERQIQEYNRQQAQRAAIDARRRELMKYEDPRCKIIRDTFPTGMAREYQLSKLGCVPD